MSTTTTTKRPYAQAREDAVAFYELFPRETFAKWSGAGSLRRKRAEVGDIDHVVIPAFGEVAGDGLFGETKVVNLLWRRLDELVASGTVRKAIIGTDGFRWGEKHRSIDFGGFRHEIYTATPENWGSVLAIRTGPGEFSKSLVVGLQRQGYVNTGGFVRNKNDITCLACGWRGRWVDLRRLDPNVQADRMAAESGNAKEETGDGKAVICPREACVRGDALELALVPVPDEETYFRLAGIRLVRPEERV